MESLGLQHKFRPVFLKGCEESTGRKRRFDFTDVIFFRMLPIALKGCLHALGSSDAAEGPEDTREQLFLVT